MEKSRLDKQYDFFREIDKEKFIMRQTYKTDAISKENDAEHAWHMAIMTILLSEYANESIDILKTVTMLLIHDLVEIDAGDTYAYDDSAKETQRQREVAAADRIFAILPEDQGSRFRALWEEFEANETPEAKFARTMDNLQPMMLNDATGGKSWSEKGVRISQVLRRNANTSKGSKELWDYAYKNILLPNVVNGNIINDENIDVTKVTSDE
ncbi:MAG: HD domain-containing protein [Lachnospiraceae bacterium]|nr:HD domain-containing protein [Lachnospiraceae bacterium]